MSAVDTWLQANTVAAPAQPQQPAQPQGNQPQGNQPQQPTQPTRTASHYTPWWEGIDPNDAEAMAAAARQFLNS